MLKDHLVRTPGQAYPNFSPAVPLSAQPRRSWGFPVALIVDLHVLPSFAVLCQSKNFVWKGGFSGLISLQHVRSIECYVHKVLVYHVSGGRERN